jgi:hypothetical protein
MDKSDIVSALMETQTDDVNNSAFVIGAAYFIRTVTHHFTGRLKDVVRCGRTHFLVLEDAAWIASDGRFTQAVDNGELEEVEPVSGQTLVNVESIIDAHPWKHPLPRQQK